MLADAEAPQVLRQQRPKLHQQCTQVTGHDQQARTAVFNNVGNVLSQQACADGCVVHTSSVATKACLHKPAVVFHEHRNMTATGHTAAAQHLRNLVGTAV